MIRPLITAAVLTLAAGAPVALGRISISASPSSGSFIDQQDFVGGKWRIVVRSTNNASPTTWTIRPTTAGEQIEFLRVNNATAGQTTIIDLRDSGSNTFAAIDDVSRSSTSSSNFVWLSPIQTGANVGRIGVTTIVAGVIGGNVSGPIDLVQVTGVNSNINQLRIVGNLTGNITLQYGGILGKVNGVGGLEVDGKIGTSTTPVNIWTRDDIRLLRAPTGAIFADIEAGKYTGGASNDLGRIEARDGVTGSVKGKQFNNLAGGGLKAGLYVTGSTGDLSANVTLSLAGAVADHTIVVGRSFLSGKTISLPADGLVGQYIFNQQNVSGAWSGTITVGGTTLSPTPSYSNLASAIGGGAAGLSRFDLHGQSSAPVSGGWSSITPSAARMRRCCAPRSAPAGRAWSTTTRIAGRWSGTTARCRSAATIRASSPWSGGRTRVGRRGLTSRRTTGPMCTRAAPGATRASA